MRLTSSGMRAHSKLRCALFAYLGLLGLSGCALAVLLARGWWPASPGDVAGLGATAERVQTAFGRVWDVKNGSGWDSARNVLYVKGAWFIYVGFNEAGRAEQFIFCKTKPLMLPSPKMSAAEQQTLLDHFKGTSAWPPAQVADFGSMWERTDEQAYATYNTESRWFVVMDQACLDRKFKSLPGHREIDWSTH